MARQRLSRQERYQLAVRRIIKNLDALGVANMRTLEMKVADAGPNDQRVNPHVLTKARRDLHQAGRIKRVEEVWFHRDSTPPARVKERLGILKPLYRRTNEHGFKLRLGQTLEIAIYRALTGGSLDFVGGFIDLDEHNDATSYQKEEPPRRFSGRAMPGDKRFDFLAFHSSGPIGIEAKNIREWVYPDRAEIKELLEKALISDALPVMIARRIPYVTFRLLNSCGVMLFENYNQLYPAADEALAAEVRAKENLGYHDVRTGNMPNPHLRRFIQHTIAANADEYRQRFARHTDLMGEFVRNELSYAAFAARIKRRELGLPEGSDALLHDDQYAEGTDFDPDDIEEDW